MTSAKRMRLACVDFLQRSFAESAQQFATQSLVQGLQLLPILALAGISLLIAGYKLTDRQSRSKAQSTPFIKHVNISPDRFQVNLEAPFTLTGVGTTWNSSVILKIRGATGGYVKGSSRNGQTITGILFPGKKIGLLELGESTDTVSASFTVVQNLTTVIVFDGDSLTRGYLGAGDNTVQATRLKITLDGLSPTAVGYNLGVGGQTIEQMQARLSTIVARYYQGGKTNVLVVQGGHNNLAKGATPAEVYAAWKSYLSTALALHPDWRVVLETELPAANPGQYPPNFDTKRDTVNLLLRSHRKNLGICQISDVAADAKMGKDGAEYDSIFFNADRTHPRTAGYSRMGAVDLQAVRAALQGCAP